MSNKTFNGTIELDIRDSVPDWGPYAAPEAPKDSPNILYLVIDDTGFGAWEMFGGKIKMPNLDRIAKKGLVYTNFHTTALCSPTRSSLLNGRNATSNGMSCIEEATTGFPGNNGRIPFENAMIAAVLADQGYSTFAVGKWHLLPEEEANLASTKRHWPLGRGFERYYGFLGGETDQWYPDLVYDNHITEQPYGPDLDDTKNGYHLSKDLVDKAITFIQDSTAIAPDKPWMLYFSPGANHAPHQIWPQKILDYGYNTTLDYIDAVDDDAADPKSFEHSSDFATGYEEYRKEVLEKMKALGIFGDEVPNPAKINPHGEGVLDQDSSQGSHESITGVPEGKQWPHSDFVRPWANLEQNEKALFVRMAEIYAAFSTYTDEQIGRLLDFLEKTGQLDNTIIIACADNGASAEGGPDGSVNENLFFNDVPDDFDKNFAMLNVLGTDKTYNHYPTGWAWAFDAPFKYWKRWSSYEGGTATPMMICGPGIGPYAKPKIYPEPYTYRKQYVHAVDVVPTLYDLLGIEPPDVVRGYVQNPIEGLSFKYTFAPEYGQPEYQSPYALPDGQWPTDDEGNKIKVRESQFYSMLGTRGIWQKGWFASTVHAPTSNWSNFDEDIWELYCLDGDTNFTYTENSSPVTGVGADPAQITNLVATTDANNNPITPAPEFKTKLQSMINEWFRQAGIYNGMPLDDRSAAQVLGSDRPTLTPEPFPEGSSNKMYTYTYYPGGSEIPEAAAPNIRTRSFAIRATIDFGEPAQPDADDTDAKIRRKSRNIAASLTGAPNPSGVLFAHGGRFGGHALYLNYVNDSDEHELVYVYNWLGQREQRASIPFIVPTPFKTGRNIHTYEVIFKKNDNADVNEEFGGSVGGSIFFMVDGVPFTPITFQLGSLPASDTSWDQNDELEWAAWNPETEQCFITQPGKFALCGEGMNIGRDAGQPVSHDYVCPSGFTEYTEVIGMTGVTLEKVEVILWNDANEANAEMEFKGMLWRD